MSFRHGLLSISFLFTSLTHAVIFNEDSRRDIENLGKRKDRGLSRAVVAIMSKSLFEKRKKGENYRLKKTQNGAAVIDRRLNDLFSKKNRIKPDVARNIGENNKDWYRDYLIENFRTRTPLCTGKETVKNMISHDVPAEIYEIVKRAIHAEVKDSYWYPSDVVEDKESGEFKVPDFRRFESVLKANFHPKFVKDSTKEERDATRDLVVDQIELFRKSIRDKITEALEDDEDVLEDLLDDGQDKLTLIENLILYVESKAVNFALIKVAEQEELKRKVKTVTLENRFVNDPIGIAVCSGSLVKSSKARKGTKSHTVVTAAHCLSDKATNKLSEKEIKIEKQKFCDNYYIVFDYDQESLTKRKGKIVDISFSPNKVYTCTGAEDVVHYSYEKDPKYEHRSSSTDTDYAVIRLDRKVDIPGVEPIKLATKWTHSQMRRSGGEKSKYVSLYGFPFGLPLKYTLLEQAQVAKVEGNLFFAPIDSHQGNSGGPVILEDGVQMGILMKSDHQSGNHVAHKTALRKSESGRDCYVFSACYKTNGNLYESIDISRNQSGNGDACSLSVGFRTVNIDFVREDIQNI
jgi:V8-like Glu-specific endopeptidase